MSIDNNDIIDAIYAYLQSVTDLTDIISTSLYWIDSDEAAGATVPYIVYDYIDDPVIEIDSIDGWQLWRFWFYSAQKGQCQDIGNILSDNLNRFRSVDQGSFGGIDVSYINRESGPGPILFDAGKYEGIHDYRISFIKGV